MVKYTFAPLSILLTANLASAEALSSAFVTRLANRGMISGPSLYISRRYAAIPYDEFAELDEEHGVILPSFPSTAGLLDIPDDNQEEVDALLASKEKRRIARINHARKSNYRVTLPINKPLVQAPLLTTNGEDAETGSVSAEELASLVAKGQQIAVANTLGMCLRQVYSGRKLSELALDVDTLRYQSFLDELQGRRINYEAGKQDESTGIEFSGDGFGSIQILLNSDLGMLSESFDGVVVSSVIRGGLAWNAGVRAGDVLAATSATIGSKLWAKSTLDGVRSAISSRKLVSSMMEFEFRHSVAEEGANGDRAEVVNSFELSLSRPIGINVEDTDDGYVTITGISDKAAPLVKDNLRVGDRIVSVESSVGAQMWEVYSTDGLTSAVTSRLPGQSVRILFERVGTVKKKSNRITPSPVKASIADAVVGFRQAGKAVASSSGASASVSQAQAMAITQNAGHTMLLSRSRDLLRTYIARNDVSKNVRVADRVIEAVIDASAILDGKTLNLLMKAYMTCGNAEKAIQTFEEVFCIAGDGSEKDVKQIHGGRLRAYTSALNIFTISALLQAHSLCGDYQSALLVLAAVEGNIDLSLNGKKPRSWLGKGDPFNMLPDTKCYNIALASAVKSGTVEGMQAAMALFDSMPDHNTNTSNPTSGKPTKNLVTFNTMIDAFANKGQYHNAYGIFRSLKKSPHSPDRITYTTLIKASIKSGNLEKAIDLLDDMKWIGIQPDIVTYNNIIESLCCANRLFEAKDLVNEMEMMHVSPDSMTYGLLMKGLLRANKPGPCLTLFESACVDEKTAALMENVMLYTTAISAAAALGDHERALELVSRMNRVGVKPNKKTLTALMAACIAGRKYDAASEIFYKMKNPDSYAISVGLNALCLAGNLDDALGLITEQRSGQKILNGKQVMVGYNKLIREALHACDYAVAREAFSGLMGAGYIPSKATFRAMIEGLDLNPDMTYISADFVKKSCRLESLNKKFMFLLFVLDSLEKRKLTVDADFYSSLLVLGAQAGGLHKRIASLLTRARKSGTQKEIALRENESSKAANTITWENLMENYSSHKKAGFESKTIFPSVRVSSKHFGRLLAAEQAVTYRGRL